MVKKKSYRSDNIRLFNMMLMNLFIWCFPTGYFRCDIFTCRTTTHNVDKKPAYVTSMTFMALSKLSSQLLK